jgi:threonine aldolase
VPGVRLAAPVEANGVFAEIGSAHARRLRKEWHFEEWSDAGEGRCVVRWMTAFDTSEADVDAFAAAVRESAVSRET